MVLGIILFILVVLFIVSIVLGAKVWRAPTLVTIIGVFLAGIAFLLLGASVLQSHRYWREVAKDLEGRIEKENRRRAQLINGVWGEEEDLTASDSAAADPSTPSGDGAEPPSEQPPTENPPTEQPDDATAKEPEMKPEEGAKEEDAAAKEEPKEPAKKEETPSDEKTSEETK